MSAAKQRQNDFKIGVKAKGDAAQGDDVYP
jgi:hypothetical protein